MVYFFSDVCPKHFKLTALPQSTSLAFCKIYWVWIYSIISLSPITDTLFAIHLPIKEEKFWAAFKEMGNLLPTTSPTTSPHYFSPTTSPHYSPTTSPTSLLPYLILQKKLSSQTQIPGIDETCSLTRSLNPLTSFKLAINLLLQELKRLGKTIRQDENPSKVYCIV